MLVRCGRCKTELEVAGAGEFVCPACGTRNAVRGAPGPAAPPYDLGGLSVPGGMPPSAPPSGPEPEINWGVCPVCAFRFAMGEVEQVTCPNCSASLVSENGALRAAD